MSTFRQWVSDFEIRFGGFAKLIDQSTELQRDFQETFSGFSVDVLRKATKELCLLDPQPFPGEVMAKLYARCKSISFVPRSHDVVPDPHKEPRYRCLECCDCGTIWVYHPKAYQPISEDYFDSTKHLNTIVVACICSAGEIEAKPREYRNGGNVRKVEGAKRFNPSTMLPVLATRMADQIAELTEFVLNSYRVQKFSGFEDWQ